MVYQIDAVDVSFPIKGVSRLQKVTRGQKFQKRSNFDGIWK